MDRRKYLATIGSVGIAGVAGCSGDDGEDGGEPDEVDGDTKDEEDTQEEDTQEENTNEEDTQEENTQEEDTQGEEAEESPAPEITDAGLVSEWNNYGDIDEFSVSTANVGDNVIIAYQYNLYIHEGTGHDFAQIELYNDDGERVAQNSTEDEQIYDNDGYSAFEYAQVFDTTEWEAGDYTAEIIIRDEVTGKVSDTFDFTFTMATPEEGGRAELVIHRKNIVPHPNTFYAHQAEFVVENIGDGHAEEVNFAIDWYEDDEYIATTDISRQFFTANSTWEVRAPPVLEDVDNANNIEVSITGVERVDEFSSDKITINDFNLLVGQEVRIRIDTTNETSDDVSLDKIGANVLDSEGIIIGNEWTYPDWSPNESQTIDLTIDTNGRIERVVDAEVFILGF